MSYKPDILETYFPDLEELEKQDIARARIKVVDMMRRHHPELDFAPGSVLGDLLINPMTTFVAGMETAMGRFMSDLDLENVANNIIWNCPFVEGYLGNFSVYAHETLQGSGVIQLVFTKDEEVTLDRGVRFAFSDGADVYYLKLPYDGDLRVLPSTGTPE